MKTALSFVLLVYTNSETARLGESPMEPPRMNRSLTSLVLVVLAGIAVYAQTAAPAANPIGATDATSNLALVRLGGQLLLAGKAYEYDRVLADDIGPRLTGSPNYVKAVDWAIAEFTRMGLSNVHRESWEIAATWEPEMYATASILAPHAQRLHLESDGWSPSTPVGGVHGRVYYLSALTPDAIRKQADQIKGALVLVDRDSFSAGNEDAFDTMLDTLTLLASQGAQALLLGEGAVNNVPSMFGLTCCSGRLASLPVANVGREDSLLLKRMLEHGPVQIEFSFTNRIREHVNVDNVVAEIPGSDAGGEYVLVGGHLDSWQLGTGAEDNGTGAASVMAVAEAIKAIGLQPKRTIRFVLFGGEEEGLLGSIRYVRAHAAELDKCAGVFITDTGSEAPKGWAVFGREDEAQALKTIKPLLDSLDAGGTTELGKLTFGTDQGPFMIHGVPSFMLWTGSDKYRPLHHTPSDTFDKVDPRDLDLGAAVVGITAYTIADAPSTLKHLSPAEVEDQFKKIKVLDEYKDMLAHHEF